MGRKIIVSIVAVLVILCLSAAVVCAKKPEVIRHDAQYLDRQVAINVQWQASESVVLVRVAAGREVKEIKVDPYDNRKTRSGYTGEIHVVLQTDPVLFQDAIPYSIQIEDEDGQKSLLTTGKVAIPTGLPPAPMENDHWGKEKRTGMYGGEKKDMIEQLRQVAQVLAAPPVLHDVVVNNPGTGMVTFKTKATHSVGLKEITFRVFDSGNRQIDAQQIPATGKFWEGTSKDFSLGSGSYFVIVQAIDASGSTSPERKASFSIRSGIPQPPIQPQPQPESQPDQSPPPPAPEQSQPPVSPPEQSPPVATPAPPQSPPPPPADQVQSQPQPAPAPTPPVAQTEQPHSLPPQSPPAPEQSQPPVSPPEQLPPVATPAPPASTIPPAQPEKPSSKDIPATPPVADHPQAVPAQPHPEQAGPEGKQPRNDQQEAGRPSDHPQAVPAQPEKPSSKDIPATPRPGQPSKSSLSPIKSDLAGNQQLQIRYKLHGSLDLDATEKNRAGSPLPDGGK